jgi:uncharacterized membrane protein YeaQ/YmgE (transglycosylase-associated protein family)
MKGSVVMWALVAVLAGFLAGFVMKRDSYGLGWDVPLGLVGSAVVSWFFQSQWVAPDPGLTAGIVVAAAGASGLFVAQRTIFPPGPRARHAEGPIPAGRAGVRSTS